MTGMRQFRKRESTVEGGEVLLTCHGRHCGVFGRADFNTHFIF